MAGRDAEGRVLLPEQFAGWVYVCRLRGFDLYLFEEKNVELGYLVHGRAWLYGELQKVKSRKYSFNTAAE